MLVYLYRKYVLRSVYVSCPDPVEAGPDFLGATWRVRYVLLFVTCPSSEHRHDTFSLATPWSKSM